jgi:large subunit ribosomal protein L17
MLSNMASSLILHKRITTTVAKAKELRKYVEPLITKAKTDSTHSRRMVFSYLQNKESVSTLFGEVAGRTSDRKGGYTRIIKLSDPRLGDAADMCLMELVDFNDLYKKDGAAKKTKTRRGRKGKKEEGAEGETTAVAATEEKTLFDFRSFSRTNL